MTMMMIVMVKIKHSKEKVEWRKKRTVDEKVKISRKISEFSGSKRHEGGQKGSSLAQMKAEDNLETQKQE